MAKFSSKKLKRGLQDISSKFRKVASSSKRQELANVFEEASKPISFASPEIPQLLDTPRSFVSGITGISIFSGGSGLNGLWLNQLLVSQALSENIYSNVISVRGTPFGESRQKEDFPDSRVQPHSFSDSQWPALFGPSVKLKTSTSKAEGQLMVFHFEEMGGAYFSKWLRLVDRCLVVIRPEFESLSEAYRIIKGTLALKPNLDYSIIYDGSAEDGRAEWVVEKFSQFVADKQRITLDWVGILENATAAASATLQFDFETVLEQGLLRGVQLEKQLFAQFLEEKRPASSLGLAV